MSPVSFVRTALPLAAMITISPALAQAVSGEALFKQRCQACHTAAPTSLMAPSLKGVVGRKAGTAKFNYSPALKAAKLVWTKENLDKFLTAPGKSVPGTRMMTSVSDSGARTAIIGHLATIR
jgi:cytochrome c